MGDMDTMDIPMLTTERDPLMLMLSLRLMLIPISCMEDTTDLDTMVLDMVTTERDPLMLMLSLRLMLTPTSCTEDTMDLDTMVLDMDTTDIPMLTTARGLLMPNPRLMLT